MKNLLCFASLQYILEFQPVADEGAQSHLVCGPVCLPLPSTIWLKNQNIQAEDCQTAVASNQMQPQFGYFDSYRDGCQTIIGAAGDLPICDVEHGGGICVYGQPWCDNTCLSRTFYLGTNILLWPLALTKPCHLRCLLPLYQEMPTLNILLCYTVKCCRMAKGLFIVHRCIWPIDARL